MPTPSIVEPTEEISTVAIIDNSEVNRIPESVPIIVTSPLLTPTKDASVSPILGATITDVLLTALPTNSVSVRKTTSTRIKSIKGIDMKNINCINLRSFAKSIGLKNYRANNKHDVCISILGYIEAAGNVPVTSPETSIEIPPLIAGVPPPVDECALQVPAGTGKSNRSIINRRRFINLLFSDMCRPGLALRGQSLNKDDLTAGLKTDQRLHELVSTEYNNKDVLSYGRNAFPNMKKGRNCDATIFDTITWQKSLSSFTSLCSEYDACFFNWKKSGHHGDFPEEPDAVPGSVKLPFEEFVRGNNSLLYLHEFVFSFPDVLSKVTCKIKNVHTMYALSNVLLT